MELRKTRKIGLWGMFLKYIFNLLVMTILLGGLYVLLFSLAMGQGVILPADYAEKQIDQNWEAISKSQILDRQLIPHTCKSGVFDKSYQYLEGDFDEQTIEDAQLFLKHSKGYRNRYILIERAEDIYVIQYDISAHFASPVLHRLFPRLELTLLLGFFVLLLALVIITALLFARKLKKELMPVMEATEQIKERNLQFELKVSHIQEFSEVLSSIQDMKTALAEALKKEWETEQRRKTHISALAHDIKTPLTIIKGNAQLLMEENMLPDIEEYMESIERSTNQIEKYIGLLIEATKDEKKLEMKRASVESRGFVRQVIKQSKELCKSYQVHLVEQVSLVKNSTLMIDEASVLRALINVVKNALEHSEGQKEIKLSLIEEEYALAIQIEDFGPGFNEEALKYATQQFFTQNIARTGTHYGLGLYITRQVIEEHGGTLIYGNKEVGSGGLVTIKLPINNLQMS